MDRCMDCGRPLRPWQRSWCYDCMRDKLVWLLRFLEGKGELSEVRQAYEQAEGLYLT